MKILCVKECRYIFFTKHFCTIQNIENTRCQIIFYGNISVDCQGAWLGIGQNWATFFTTDLFTLTTKFWATERRDYIVIFRKYKAFWYFILKYLAQNENC